MSRGRARSIKVPVTTITLLTWTGKMPGPSFSLPARRTCPNAHGTICASCYAAKGQYVMPNVKQAQEARLRWTVKSMRTEEGRREWVRYMAAAIEATRAEYFRIHDSGDFFSVRYAECWLRVVKALPDVKFWAPTREWQVKPSVFAVIGQRRENERLPVLRRLNRRPNCVVRPSALEPGFPPPRVKGLAAGAGVNVCGTRGVEPCPARSQGNQCGDCRRCWDEPRARVSFAFH